MCNTAPIIFRSEKEAVAISFLNKVDAKAAAAVELRDVVPLLEAVGLYQGIVQVSIKKADAAVRSLVNQFLILRDAAFLSNKHSFCASAPRPKSMIAMVAGIGVGQLDHGRHT